MIIEKIKRSLFLFKFDNWFQLLVNRLLWPGNGPLVYKLGRMEVFIDHSSGDQDGTRSCLVPALYAPCIKALAGLPSSLNVLDLGANGGGFLLYLSHLGYGIRKAVAVELNPHTWSRMNLNIFRNFPESIDRMILLNGAAGNRNGVIKVSLGRGSVGDSINNNETDGYQYQIKQFSLASLIDRFEGAEIDLCKIDIEGAEYELLENIGSENLRTCRNIIIEIHEVPDESAGRLKELIFSHGFAEVAPQGKMIENNVYVFSRLD
jgi:FkbM family methyltransferase